MSQITRCPACKTQFKVATDQLRASEGWVRCGNCDEIFDAAAHLVPLDAFPVLSKAVPTQRPGAEPQVPDALPGADSSIDLDFPSLEPSGPLEGQAAVPVDGAQDTAVDPGLLGAKLSFPEDAREPVGTEAADLLSDRIAAEMDEVVLHLHESAEEPPVPDWMARTSAVDDGLGSATPGLLPDAPAPGEDARLPEPEAASAPTSGLAESAPAPSFDKALEAATVGAALGAVAGAAAAAATPGPSRWDHLGVRIALAFACVLLVFGLLIQSVVQWREPILVWSRSSLGTLQALCAPFNCTLAPPRNIADLVIDASGFRHVQGDRYELSMTLKNRAKTPLAMPVLELTLTDDQDQPLVRRVLQPADLGAPPELLPRKRWEAAVPVVLTAPDLPVAGYRLLAFYP